MRYGWNVELELHQLELRYEKLRRRNASKERRLVASLAEKGQQLPVVVVGGTDSACSYVLLDGYKRVRALKKLRHDTVRATVWDLYNAFTMVTTHELNPFAAPELSNKVSKLALAEVKSAVHGSNSGKEIDQSPRS